MMESLEIGKNHLIYAENLKLAHLMIGDCLTPKNYKVLSIIQERHRLQIRQR